MHDPVYDYKPDPPTPAELAERAAIMQAADVEVRDLLRAGATLTGNDRAIYVWSFYDAPAFLQRMSEHGGDEDWIVVMPSGHSALEWCHWLNCMSHGEEPSRYDLPCGAVVFIAAH